MHAIRHSLLASALIAPLLAFGASPRHDVAWFEAIARNGYAVPEGTTAFAVVEELASDLGSTDPHLRDELAYDISARWIYSKRLLTADELRTLIARLTPNLARGLGERNTDSVLLRSFSALDLSVIVAVDSVSPFLTADEFHGLLSATLAYLAGERDLRPFDEQKGWMHATAHTADLLKFLARGRHLTHADQAAILGGLANRLTSAEAFTAGEDGRLARVVVSLVARPDFDLDGFRQWASTLKVPDFPERPSAAPIQARTNVRNFLLNAYALMNADERSQVSGSEARGLILQSLRKLD